MSAEAVPRFVPAPDTRPQDTAWPVLRWPPPSQATLAGRIVTLVQAAPSRDGQELFRVLDDDRVWQHVAARPLGAESWADRLEQGLAAGALPWLVRLRRPHAGLSAGTVVGVSSYSDVSVAAARLEIGGTAYTPRVWGTAVNPDTKFALLAYAFDVLGAGRVQLKTDVRNVRSQQAIARLGARYEGTLRRYQRRADGTVRDTALFSVVAEDWPSVRELLTRRLDEALDSAAHTPGRDSTATSTYTSQRAGGAFLQQAEVGDAEALLALREAAAGWLAARGVRQWEPGEVTLAQIYAQVVRGQWYVARVQRDEDVSAAKTVAGALRLLWQDEEIWGSQPPTAGYAHGLVVDRRFAGSGLGRAMLEWAGDLIRGSGRDRLRLDCGEDNAALRDYYYKLGFTAVGRRDFAGRWYSVVLLEKRLLRG